MRPPGRLDSLELELLRAKRLASAGAILVPSGKSGVIVTLSAVFAIWLYERRPVKTAAQPRLPVWPTFNMLDSKTSGRYFKEEV